MTAARRLGGALLLLFGAAVAGGLIHRHAAARQTAPGGGALPDVTLEPAPPPGQPGLLVTSLRSTGPAARRGLRVGDRIEAIDGQAVASLRDVARRIGEDGNPVLTLRLRRGDHRVDVRIDRRPQGASAHGA